MTRPRTPPDFTPPAPFNWPAALGCALLIAGTALWAAAKMGAFL